MIACISDTHLTVPEFESGSLWPRQMSVLGKEGPAFYEIIRQEIDLAYTTCLAWLKEQGKWSMAVHLGDITGGFQEKGCYFPSARELVRKVKQDLSALAPKTHIVLGDHDTGYTHKGAMPGSGFNEESVAVFPMSDVHWAEECDGMLHIGVCSPVAENSESNSFAKTLHKEQLAFLGDTLSSWKGNWVLYIHRPLAISHFTKQIRGHENALVRLVHGHYHDTRKSKLMKAMWNLGALTLQAGMFDWGSAGKEIRQCLRKSMLCPSVAPLWCRGYGLLANQRVVCVPKPKASDKNLPTASFLKCLWWMIRPQS